MVPLRDTAMAFCATSAGCRRGAPGAIPFFQPAMRILYLNAGRARAAALIPPPIMQATRGGTRWEPSTDDTFRRATAWQVGCRCAVACAACFELFFATIDMNDVNTHRTRETPLRAAKPSGARRWRLAASIVAV